MLIIIFYTLTNINIINIFNELSILIHILYTKEDRHFYINFSREFKMDVCSRNN
jgi:hypothetical protein